MRRVIVLALPLISVLAMLNTPANADPSVVGRWLPAFSEDGNGDGIGDFAARAPRTRAEAARLPTAVNVAVLPDGRVLYWSQLEGTEAVNQSIALQLPSNPRSRSRVLDLSGYFATGTSPAASSWSVPSPEHGGAGDMVGTDQRSLPDGRVLTIGGTEWRNDNDGTGVTVGRTELYGTSDARTFDPISKTWTRAQDMHHRRYYPSMITLPDGHMLVAGGADRLVYDSAVVPGAHPGTNVLPQNVTDVERFDPATGTWTLGGPASRAEMVLFAHLHLLPDGSVLHPAAGMIFPPGGADADAHEWAQRRVFDPASGSWTTVGVSSAGVRGNAFSVLMPLTPPYDSAQVLVAGGTVGGWPGSYAATPLTELVSWSSSSGVSAVATPGAPLNAGRWQGSSVLLPGGEVVAVSGSDRDEVIDPGSAFAVRTAEMLDPASGLWRTLAPASRDRTLHNTAVLLRDGSILVGGHSPAPAHYGAHQENSAPFASNLKDPSFEIFQPPYLFRGPRPSITSVSAASVAPGGTLTLGTARDSDPTLKVVLTRLPSTTHGIDNDQRSVVLSHVASGTGSVTASVPGASVVPPGHYYVFLVADNGSGPTPSVAEIVRVG